MRERIIQTLTDASKSIASLARQADLLEKVATLMAEAFNRDGKVLVFGNGGSAADSQHFAAELVGRFERERRPLRALALTVNTSCLTCIGNDYGFDDIFSRQLEAHGSKGDIAFAISTSGNSPNILKAVAKAKELGLITIGMTGENGGRLKDSADHCLCAPSSRTARIQEAHITIIHILCGLVEETLFPAGRGEKAHPGKEEHGPAGKARR